MAPVQNAKVVFAEVPKDFPIPGQHIVYDDKDTVDLDSVPLDGGVLVKVLYLSVDPYLRGRMRPPNTESYLPPFDLGKPMNGFGVGVVVRSEAENIKAGNHVTAATFSFEQYTVLSVTDLTVLPEEQHISWSQYLGAAGMPGLTAYTAWKEYAAASAGETVFVSTGAGAVGSMVAQLAKMEGLKVIASAGSDEKVQFMREIGVDVPFNYKTTNTREVLAKEGPIHIYWDNVGGETLDAAMEGAAKGARIIACGSISSYNTGPKPVYNTDLIFSKCLHLHGFLVGALADKYQQQFYAEVPALVASGKVKLREQIVDGMDKLGELLVAVQKGINTGKAVIKVADE